MDNAHDDGISSLQVQTETTSTRGEDEHLNVRVLRIELLDVASTIFRLGTTIKTEVLPAHHLEEVLHDIHHLRHLEEDEHLFTS